MPKNRKPTHPGQILFEEFLKPLHMTSRQFAEKLGAHWTELAIEAIIKGKENISENAAKEFALCLDTTPEFWAKLQNIYSNWESTHHRNEKGSLKPWKKAQ